MNNTTYSVKGNEIESKWYILDAANKPVGRVATEAARLLTNLYTKLRCWWPCNYNKLFRSNIYRQKIRSKIL